MKATLTLLIILLVAPVIVLAQNKAITFGLKAGISAVSFKRTPQQDVLVKEPDTAKVGFYAGAFASLNIGRFSIQPGVFFNIRGGKTTEEVYQGDIVFRSYGSWRLYYVQVPVNLLYHMPIGAGSFYFGAGPYISTALSGRFTAQRIDGKPINDRYVEAFSFKATIGGNKYRSIKRSDYGANALLGFRFNSGLLIDLGYDLGLANIDDQNFIYSSTKNRSLHFGVGYQF